ncbi:hypothetical protein SpCBS45565_g06138 [Spizellomyces sp. 'palustris']|nr:hypothetical protein SpCBS45565_g06138 [Spizellomyces sp. 'palustris']
MDSADQIVHLNERLTHLEAITAPSLLSLTSDGRGKLEGSLLRSLQGIQDKLLQIAQERRGIGDFFHKYARLEVSLLNDKVELETGTLDAAAKRDILLASEDDLTNYAHLLKELNSLKNELDSPVLQGLEALIPRLNETEARYIKQRHQEEGLRRRLCDMLTTYNRFVNTLSEIFIWYEETLSKLEQQVVQYEVILGNERAH